MLVKVMQRAKEIALGFSKREKLFLLAAFLCSFFISSEYAIIRPVSNSLFIQYFGAKAFPYAWLLAIPLNLSIVYLYNRFLPRVKCLSLFLLVASSVCFVNTLASIFMAKSPSFTFFFYMWKDVYVMLMFQLLWSVIHSTIDLNKAKFLYGLLFGIGALGGLSGSLFTGSFAVAWGSESLLFMTIPIYFCLALSYRFLIKNSLSVDQSVSKEIKSKDVMKDSFQIIARSKVLTAILLMVVFMQVTATITDFQFNHYLEKLFPEKDLRTAYLGKLLGLGNIMTMSFQFIGVYVLIRSLGRFKTHLLVPLTLSISVLSFISFPAFGMITFSFLTIKCFDFSLFNVIKEMLYIPLKTEEKFRAKAIIDVFAYRGAKVLASFFILFLQAFFTSALVEALSWINACLFILWCFVVVSIKKSYQEEKVTSVN